MEELRGQLDRVLREGAPAQSEQAAQFLRRLDRGEDVRAAGAQLVDAFLHDPDLWR